MNISDSRELPVLTAKLKEGGFKIYQIDCSNIHDGRSFFEAALQILPMGDAKVCSDENWRFPANWDAFNDFFWQGLTERNDEYVAIILINTRHLIDEKTGLLRDICASFEHLARLVINGDEFSGILPILLETFLF